MKHDLGALEALHFEMLAEVTSCARRLALAARISETTALAVSAAHSRETTRLLTELMKAENRPRRGARKGVNGRRSR